MCAGSDSETGLRTPRDVSSGIDGWSVNESCCDSDENALAWSGTALLTVFEAEVEKSKLSGWLSISSKTLARQERTRLPAMETKAVMVYVEDPARVASFSVHPSLRMSGPAAPS